MNFTAPAALLRLCGIRRRETGWSWRLCLQDSLDKEKRMPVESSVNYDEWRISESIFFLHFWIYLFYYTSHKNMYCSKTKQKWFTHVTMVESSCLDTESAAAVAVWKSVRQWKALNMIIAWKVNQSVEWWSLSSPVKRASDEVEELRGGERKGGGEGTSRTENLSKDVKY